MITKTIILAIIIVLASSKRQLITKEEALEKAEIAGKILLGVVEGFLSEGAKDAIKCMNDAETAFGDFELAYKDFSKKTTDGTMHGFTDIASALMVLKNALKDCQAAEVEIVKLEKSIIIMSTPQSFMYEMGIHVLFNGVDIYNEIETAITDWKSKSYIDFGAQIGKILEQLFIDGDEYKIFETLHFVDQTKYLIFNNTETIALIFGGVAEGFFEKEIPQMTGCIDDSKTVFSDFDMGIKDLNEKSITGIKNGLVLIGSGLKSLEGAMSMCQNKYKDIFKLFQAIEAISSPWQLEFHVGKALLVNGKDILGHIKTASENWNSKKWEEFGENIGDIIADVAGQPKSLSSKRILSQKDLLVYREY